MKKRTLGNVYFLQAGDNGPIKIGYTSGVVTRRVQTLQQSSPEILNWIGAYISNPDEELRLHNKFKPFRYRQEWFTPDGALTDYIKSCCPFFDQSEYTANLFRPELQNVIRQNFSYSNSHLLNDLAEISGIGRRALSRWMEKRWILDNEDLELIERSSHWLIAEKRKASA